MIAALTMTALLADVPAIQSVQTAQAAAWNAHDASAYASLFTPDGVVVNILGWKWQGRDEIKTKLTAAFAWVFKDSVLTIKDVEVRMVTPTIAVAYVRWTMTGAKAPPGAPAPPGEGIQLQVLEKKDEGWLISEFQNTASVPEKPFPDAPSQTPPANFPADFPYVPGARPMDLTAVKELVGSVKGQPPVGEMFEYALSTAKLTTSYTQILQAAGWTADVEVANDPISGARYRIRASKQKRVFGLSVFANGSGSLLYVFEVKK